MNRDTTHINQYLRTPSIWTGLPFKMVWLSALAGMLIMIMAAAFQITNELKIKRSALEQDIYNIMNALSGAAAEAAYQVDTDKAQLVIAGIFEFPTVSHVRIDIDIGGSLAERATNTLADTPKPLARFLLGEKSHHKMILTVPNRLKSVGTLHVWLNVNQIADQFVAAAWEKLLFIFIAVTIFATTSGVLFYFLLAKPLVNASTELGVWLDDIDGDITISIPKFNNNDEVGKLLHSVKTVVAARKELDTKLKHQQHALDEHAIVSITDISGKIISVNEKFIEISGYTREELLGNTHRIIKSGEHPQEFYEDLWGTISSGKPWTGEVRNLKKNLESYWVKATIYPFLDETGKISQYISIRTDITELKNKEVQIQRFKSTLDSMKDEIYMFWPDTFQIFYANEAAITRTGIEEEELCKLTPIDINNGHEKRFIHDQLKLLKNGTNAEFNYESLQFCSDGTARPVETFIELIIPEGEKPRFVAITSDISERLEIAKAKSEFVSTVSHELRTPLTSIMGAIGLVKAGTLGEVPEKATAVLDIAYSNGERLKNLINDILDLEKSEAGMLDIQLESLDIAALIDDAIESNKGFGDEYDITFIASGIDDPVLVDGDGARIMQVLSNLMSNAAKFSHKGEVVEVSLTQYKDRIRISVIDTGSGIPAAAQPSIFEKFTQADSSDQRQKGGTGLGLSIAKSIVEAMGGTIDFTSEVGKGTTFFFDLKTKLEGK